MKTSPSKTRRMSLSAKILLGMGLGIIVGIFFGEQSEPIGIVGQVFVQLLQMAILPFLMVSLITGLGSLTFEGAISMGKKAGGILVLLWVIALTVVGVLPLTFPQWPSAMFFSLLSRRDSTDRFSSTVYPFQSIFFSCQQYRAGRGAV